MPYRLGLCGVAVGSCALETCRGRVEVVLRLGEDPAGLVRIGSEFAQKPVEVLLDGRVVAPVRCGLAPARCCPALTGPVAHAVAPSIACMPRANVSQSARLASRAFRPAAVCA